MRRWGCLLLILLPLLLFVSAQPRAELKFATQEFAPFSYMERGKVSGPVADLIRAICEEMKLSCSFQLSNWLRAQWFVKQGDMNGLFVIGWNEERAKTLYFSPPIIDTEYGFFVRKDNSLDYRDEADVLHYRVGVYGPSNTEKSLLKIKKNIKKMTVNVNNDDARQFKKLSAGEFDAIYSNMNVGFFLIDKLELENIRYAGTHKKLKYYIGFSKKHTRAAEVNLFNRTLFRLYLRGDVKKIFNKYHMTPSKIDPDKVQIYSP
ncbi:substrate-binding periplasmic protein [Dongshaea marina]|uniref:substrate-binding periplasmic protein n=1 Tax=Dongshaea marina TaxID=2047966 RepID=UPI00131EF376|nr:transporter substrate-binding domain-containing protein [Dongshaea marina]